MLITDTQAHNLPKDMKHQTQDIKRTREGVLNYRYIKRPHLNIYTVTAKSGRS